MCQFIFAKNIKIRRKLQNVEIVQFRVGARLLPIVN